MCRDRRSKEGCRKGGAVGSFSLGGYVCAGHWRLSGDCISLYYANH